MVVSSRVLGVVGLVLGFLGSSCAAARSPQAEGAGASVQAESVPGVDAWAVDVRELPRLERIIPRLDGVRVVFVGESHDRYEHHLIQLAVVKALHERRGGGIAIGMEYFQQPYQRVLDDYVAGRISERELLVGTEYYDRWRFDYRLYRPILQYAREQGIPLIALNVPAEITTKAGRSGLEGLSEEERAAVPAEIDRSDEAYHERLRRVFDHHPQGGSQVFERFLDVQLIWDEGMAERAARYLQENPRRTLAVLAGSGHIAYRSGIPNRVARRTGLKTAVLLPVESGSLEPGIADFLISSTAEPLPPAGRLGARIETAGEQLKVAGFEPGSGAEEAGMRVDDRVVAIDGQALARFADLRVALLDKRPGDTAQVEIRRPRWFRTDDALTLPVTLR
jgi:uncharacterized iron-regulated protein